MIHYKKIKNKNMNENLNDYIMEFDVFFDLIKCIDFDEKIWKSIYEKIIMGEVENVLENIEFGTEPEDVYKKIINFRVSDGGMVSYPLRKLPPEYRVGKNVNKFIRTIILYDANIKYANYCIKKLKKFESYFDNINSEKIIYRIIDIYNHFHEKEITEDINKDFQELVIDILKYYKYSKIFMNLNNQTNILLKLQELLIEYIMLLVYGNHNYILNDFNVDNFIKPYIEKYNYYKTIFCEYIQNYDFEQVKSIVAYDDLKFRIDYSDFKFYEQDIDDLFTKILDETILAMHNTQILSKTNHFWKDFNQILKSNDNTIVDNNILSNANNSKQDLSNKEFINALLSPKILERYSQDEIKNRHDLIYKIYLDNELLISKNLNVNVLTIHLIENLFYFTNMKTFDANRFKEAYQLYDIFKSQLSIYQAINFPEMYCINDKNKNIFAYIGKKHKPVLAISNTNYEEYYNYLIKKSPDKLDMINILVRLKAAANISDDVLREYLSYFDKWIEVNYSNHTGCNTLLKSLCEFDMFEVAKRLYNKINFYGVPIEISIKEIYNQALEKNSNKSIDEPVILKQDNMIYFDIINADNHVVSEFLNRFKIYNMPINHGVAIKRVSHAMKLEFRTNVFDKIDVYKILAKYLYEEFGDDIKSQRYNFIAVKDNTQDLFDSLQVSVDEIPEMEIYTTFNKVGKRITLKLFVVYNPKDEDIDRTINEILRLSSKNNEVWNDYEDAITDCIISGFESIVEDELYLS